MTSAQIEKFETGLKHFKTIFKAAENKPRNTLGAGKTQVKTAGDIRSIHLHPPVCNWAFFATAYNKIAQYVGANLAGCVAFLWQTAVPQNSHVPDLTSRHQRSLGGQRSAEFVVDISAGADQGHGRLRVDTD